MPLSPADLEEQPLLENENEEASKRKGSVGSCRTSLGHVLEHALFHKFVITLVGLSLTKLVMQRTIW